MLCAALIIAVPLNAQDLPQKTPTSLTMGVGKTIFGLCAGICGGLAGKFLLGECFRLYEETNYASTALYAAFLGITVPSLFFVWHKFCWTEGLSEIRAALNAQEKEQAATTDTGKKQEALGTSPAA